MVYRYILLFAMAMLWSDVALAQGHAGEVAIDPEKVTLGARHYSPFVDQSYPNRVFWGDTHLNTSYSTSVVKCQNYPTMPFGYSRSARTRRRSGTHRNMVLKRMRRTEK